MDLLLQTHMVNLLKISKLRVFMLCGFCLDDIFMTLPDPAQAHDFLLNELLLSLISKKKKDIAITIQAYETLQMTSGGQDNFGKRIEANFDHVILSLSSAINEVKKPQFFDLLDVYVKRFRNNFTEDNLRLML